MNNTSDYNKLTNLKQDNTYSKDFSAKSYQTLKYYTNNYNDPQVNMDKLLVFQQQHANVDNSLRYSEVVSDRQKIILPPLPLATSPNLMRGQQDVVMEDQIRPNLIRDRKSCNPKDNESYKRSFYIFDNMPIRYNTENVSFTQKDHSHRGGVDTRNVKYDYYNSK
jgi:hypothetical protein